MRTRESIYDDLLRHQTELSFDLEQSFFRSTPGWHSAAHVLDFGAGNCYYTRRLAERHPDKHFTCVEQNRDLIARAKSWAEPYAIELTEGSFTDLVQPQAFDFVLARHSFSYLTDRTSFIAWVWSHTSPGAGVLVIDADDAQFLVHPRMPLLERGNEEFKQQVSDTGGQRTLRDDIKAQWEQHGFRHIRTEPTVVHSDICGRRSLMHMFMMAIAEYDHGYPLPLPLREELDSWLHNPNSYLQYGLFGSSFQKPL